MFKRLDKCTLFKQLAMFKQFVYNIGGGRLNLFGFYPVIKRGVPHLTCLVLKCKFKEIWL